jgi:hypothetical protein
MQTSTNTQTITNNQARLYSCGTLKLSPGDNIVPNEELREALKHPLFRKRLELKLLVWQEAPAELAEMLRHDDEEFETIPRRADRHGPASTANESTQDAIGGEGSAPPSEEGAGDVLDGKNEGAPASEIPADTKATPKVAPKGSTP